MWMLYWWLWPYFVFPFLVLYLLRAWEFNLPEALTCPSFSFSHWVIFLYFAFVLSLSFFFFFFFLFFPFKICFDFFFGGFSSIIEIHSSVLNQHILHKFLYFFKIHERASHFRVSLLESKRAQHSLIQSE